MFHTLALAAATMVVAVPMGVAFAIGLDRWRGRPARAANATVLFSFVVPEIVLGVSFFLLFTTLFRSVVGELNAVTQVIGLVTYQLSYAVIIVRARLLSIGKEYEEAAMDLGASPVQAVRRVLLPLLYPAIFASLAIVFADSVDDFVLVRYTCASAACEPLSVKIYSAARASPTPAVNAAATAMLVMTLVAVAIGFVAYRVASSGQRKRAADEFVGLQV
jgi:spermidine/putrescine transport system permease protein